MISIYFLSLIFFEYKQGLKGYFFSYNLALLILSISIYLISFLFTNYISQKILKLIGIDIAFLKMLKIITLPQVASYVPGRIMGYLSLIDLSNIAGIPSVKIVTWIGISQIFTVTISLIFGSITLFFLPELFKLIYLVPFLLIFFLSIFNPKTFNWISINFFKLIKKDPIIVKFDLKNMVLLILLFIIETFIQGLSFSIFITAFFDVSYKLFFLSIFLFPLARIIGYLTIISPGGFGIQEGIIIFILKRYIFLDAATFISLAYRFLSIFCLGIISLFCLPIKLQKDDK